MALATFDTLFAVVKALIPFTPNEIPLNAPLRIGPPNIVVTTSTPYPIAISLACFSYFF